MPPETDLVSPTCGPTYPASAPFRDRALIYPYWSNAYFFSKPILTLWLMAFGLLLAGAEQAPAGAPLPDLVEWGVRLPFGLLAILTLWSVYRLGSFLAAGDRRVGLLASLVLGTSPTFVFIGRQAITDLPLVASTMAGLAFLLPAIFTPIGERPRPAASLRALAAGFVAAAAWIVIAILAGGLPDSWPIWTGLALLALFLAIDVLRSTDPNAPGLAVASTFFGFAALAKGLEVLALVLPVFLATVLVLREPRAILRPRPLRSLAVFFLVAAPWYVTLASFDGRDEEGLSFVGRFFGHDHFARIASGVHGDRGGAGYYGEQILYGFFPWSVVLPLAVLGMSKLLERSNARRGAILFVLFYGLWVYVFFTASETKLHHYVFPAIPALALLVALWVGTGVENTRRALGPGAIALMAAIYMVALRDLISEPRDLVNLFTYKYDRAYPSEVHPRPFIAVIGGVGGLLALAALLRGRAKAAFRALALTALVFALWLAHHHYNMLSPHWSQAHLFKTYYAERRPGEPLIAYQLNWRGETFYSRNQAIEVMNNSAAERLRDLVNRPGRSFVLIEATRFAELRAALPPAARERLEILDRSNNHFYLCVVNDG